MCRWDHRHCDSPLWVDILSVTPVEYACITRASTRLCKMYSLEVNVRYQIWKALFYTNVYHIKYMMNTTYDVLWWIVIGIQCMSIIMHMRITTISTPCTMSLWSVVCNIFCYDTRPQGLHSVRFVHHNSIPKSDTTRSTDHWSGSLPTAGFGTKNRKLRRFDWVELFFLNGEIPQFIGDSPGNLTQTFLAWNSLS